MIYLQLAFYVYVDHYRHLPGTAGAISHPALRMGLSNRAECPNMTETYPERPDFSSGLGACLSLKFTAMNVFGSFTLKAPVSKCRSRRIGFPYVLNLAFSVSITSFQS